MPVSSGILWIIDACLVVVGWALFTLIFFFRPRPPRPIVRRRNYRSWYGIGLEVGGCVVVGAGLRSAGTPLLHVGVIEEGIFTLVAGIVMAGSLLLTRSAVVSLGRQWSLGAEVVEGHELVTSGAYGLVRHPIYSAMFGMFLGSGLAVSSWWALLAGGAVFLAGTALRIRSEEDLLVGEFGEMYRDYARRVPALLPWPRCA